MIASLFGLLVKVAVIVFMLRMVITQQEAIYNPYAQLITSKTDKMLRSKKTGLANVKIIPLLIIGFLLFYALSAVTFMQAFPGTFLQKFSVGLMNVLNFMTIVYVVFIIIGLLSGTGSIFPQFFFRIGNVWIKPARKLTGIKSNWVVLPALVLLMLVYCICLLGINMLGNPTFVIDSSVWKLFVRALIALFSKMLGYFNMLLIVRVIMSWFSPDPRNPLVQLIYTVTEPILGRVRRFIPPLGMLDLSALVVFALLAVLQQFLVRLYVFI